MKKILGSIVISALVAFLSANIISKTTKFKWEMILNYEHISNSYDVDFSVLSKRLNIEPIGMFNSFMQKLDSKVTLKDSKNPCSKVRTTATQPNILVSLDSIGQLSVIVRSEDKRLLIQCEKYIDAELVNFEIYTNNFIQKIIKNLNEEDEERFNLRYVDDVNMNVVDSNTLEEEQKELELMLEYTIKDIIKTNTNEPLDVLSMKELSQALQVLARLNAMKPEIYTRKRKFKNTTVKTFNIIEKTSRQMIYKKDSTKLLGFSIYVILQSIFLMVFFSKSTYAREKKIKKKIYNFFN